MDEEDKYKKRHIGRFKGCLHKINELGKSKKIGPITNYYYSDKLLTTKEKNIKDKFYNNPKWSELSQITRETRWNEYAKYLGPYSYDSGFTEEITYGFGWKNPFPELIKREKILKEKYKYKNGKMRKDKDYISWESIQNEKRFVINQTKYGFGKYHEHRREIAEELETWYLKKKQEDVDKIKMLNQKLNKK